MSPPPQITVFSYYARIGQVDESDNVRQGYFTEMQLAAVFANMPSRNADFVEWSSITGQRRSEVRQPRGT